MLDTLMPGGQITMQGAPADVLMANNMNPNAIRPWVDAKGQSWISIVENGKLKAVRVANATATLRKDDWKLLDDAILKVARPKLKAVGDLRSRGLTFNIPNGMSKTILETEKSGDTNDASVSMDALRQNQNDRPEFILESLPLPIIHKDFSYSLRQIMVSRNGGSPLDTTTAEMAARKVAEEAEKMLIGVSTTADQYSFGGGTIYGYTDFPGRLTKTITDPTASGWTGETLVNEILAMMQQSSDNNYNGPWTLYMSKVWRKYLGADYTSDATNNNNQTSQTLQARIESIADIEKVALLDYLPTATFDIVLIQMTTDVIREIIGMDITTVQWDTEGGMKKNFKVMAIMVPQLRSDFESQTGIVHGTTS